MTVLKKVFKNYKKNYTAQQLAMHNKCFFITPNWPAPSYVHAYTSTRKGGYSSPPFNHFSLGEENTNNTAKSLFLNQKLLQETLKLSENPIWIHQVHGNEAIFLDENIKKNFKFQADAVYTFSPNKVCAIRTADCIPLFICSLKSHNVAMIHAGWRGLFAGIIEKTLKKLPDYSENLLVWLGPAISQHHYQVDETFKKNFCDRNFKCEIAFIMSGNGQWQADLYTIAKIFLQEQGIAINNIYGGNFCTYSQEDLFYSHRRDKITGRMASLIWTS